VELNQFAMLEKKPEIFIWCSPCQRPVPLPDPRRHSRRLPTGVKADRATKDEIFSDALLCRLERSDRDRVTGSGVGK
jgi:hypothetical protein